MRLEDKLKLLNGKDFWTTYSNEDCGIGEIVFCDGPTGLRFQAGAGDHLGLSDSSRATCFPTASALSCSWDDELVEEVASCIAEEAMAEGVDVVLGPGVNIKRSPLCGRNFEYFSEDPFLTKEMGAAFVIGLQKNGIGASLKHFAGNNQEDFRMSVNIMIDERALHEIYLKAFEDIIREARPWTVMSAYNRLNGVHCSENGRLLTEILRDRWKYDGLVVSDWYAVNDIVKSINNGLDLEMPSVGRLSFDLLAEAYGRGELEAAVNRAVGNISRLAARCRNKIKHTGEADFDGHHALARKAAVEAFVLLKNDRRSLPLAGGDRLLCVGELMNSPLIQGGGSSRVNPARMDAIPEELLKAGITFAFEPGYKLNDENISEELAQRAVKAAENADKIVFFAGLFEYAEAESYDRRSLDLPACQEHLLERLAGSGRELIVVLQTGSAVVMPWIDKADTVLQMHLSGQGAGKALTDILTGETNPSGKLTETYPVKLRHIPSALFGGTATEAVYGESIFVGYRYYDKKELEVLFPFGHGLSYTEFEYEALEAGVEGEEVLVEVTVKNKGACAGKEVVQVYVGLNEAAAVQPVRKLAAYKKVHLAPGEERRISFRLPDGAFKYYDASQREWIYATGSNIIEVGKSSRDIELKAAVEISASNRKYRRIDPNTTVGEIRGIPALKAVIDEQVSLLLEQLSMTEGEAINPRELETSVYYMPLRNAVQITKGEFSYGDLNGFIGHLNGILEKMGALYDCTG